MEYKRIERGNHNLHLIKYNRFKTITTRVVFTKNFEQRDIEYFVLLTGMLTRYSKKYNTTSILAKKLEDLYSCGIFSTYKIRGGIVSLEVNLNFINPKYTEDTMYEESFDLLKESLLNPLVKNGAFDEDKFNLIKEEQINNIRKTKESSIYYAKENFYSIFLKGTSGEYSASGSIENYERITAKDLYTFYKKLFTDYKIDVFVLGDFIEEKIISNISLILNKKTNPIKLNEVIQKVEKDKVIEKTDKIKNNQSTLLMGYVLKDITEFEHNYVAVMYNLILGGMLDSVLFMHVREENSICYSINSNYQGYYNTLSVYAGINKDNYEKAVKLINESIDIMKDENKLKSYYDKACKSIQISINDFYDDINKIINHYCCREFNIEDEIHVREEKIKSVTLKDIVEFANKLELKTIYMLEGNDGKE